MKYEELLDVARRQDVPEDVGPPVEVVLEQVAAAPSPGGGIAVGTKVWWWGAVVVGIVAVGAVTLGGRWRSGLAAPSEDRPATQEVQVARSVPAESPREAVPSAPSAAPSVTPDVTPPRTGSAVAEPLSASASASGDAVARPRGGRGKRRATTSTNPEDLYREIEAHLAAGERGAARRKLVRLVTRYPRWKGHATAMIDLAHLEEQTGDTAAAYCTYRRFLGRHGGDVLAAEARRAVDRLASRFPEGPPACE